MFNIILKNRLFRKLVSASFISQLGSWFTYMLLIVLSYDKSHSIGSTMGVTAASSIGTLVAGSVAGTFIERRSPVRVMVLTNFLSCIAIGSVFWLPHDVKIYYIAAFVIAVLSAFFNPAYSKYQVIAVPKDQLMDSNAALQLIREIVKIIGPGIAVTVLGLLPTSLKSVGFLFDASSYLIASAIFVTELSRFVTPETNGSNHQEKKKFLKSWLEGMEPLRDGVVLSIFFMYIFILIGIAGVDVTLTAKVSSIGYSSLQVGYVIGAISAGLIATSVFGTKYVKKWPITMRLAGATLGIGVFYGGIGYGSNLWLMMLFAFCLGIFNAIYNISASTYWQEVIPLEKLGRFFGFVSTLFSVVGLLGLSLNGVLGTYYSTSFLIYFSGGLIAVTGFISIFTISFAIRKKKTIQSESQVSS